MNRWYTILSAESLEELIIAINSYYHSDSYKIGNNIDNNHFDVIDSISMKKAYIARYYNNIWQYGYYSPTKEKIQKPPFFGF